MCTEATKETPVSILGFLTRANAKGNSTASNFSVQILLGRAFCVTHGLIRIQAHHALS